MRYALEVPKLSSLILKHSLDAPLAGLDTIPRDEQPPVAIVFWSFRVMVALGFAMLGLGVWALVARMRGRMYDSPWLHRAAVALGPSGFVAVTAGWITTEVGRQPYTIYGQLRTIDSVAPIAAPAVAFSLVVFILVYFAVFGAGVYYILRLMAHAPHPGEKSLKDQPGPTRAAGHAPAAATGEVN